MIALAPVLAAMLSLAPYTADRAATADEREALLQPLAYEISMVSRTPSEGALLVAVAFHESGFARYVLTGHCSEGPPGQRCDGGKARGPWQLHRQACPAAWGPTGDLRTEATCALALLRWGGQQCREHARTPVLGAVGMFAGRGCHWSGAETRAKTATTLLAAWGRK